MKDVSMKDGWLIHARHVQSTNADARPPGVRVDTLVVHGISLPPGQFGRGFVEALFTNTLPTEDHPFFAAIAGLRVSAHVVIARTGRITQFASFNDRAWHAGVSHFRGRDRVNDFAVGVELEGTDDCPYTPAQYRELARLARELMRVYPGLTRDRIIGHSDIAPGRKTDPGFAFDWAAFGRALDRH